MCIKEEYTEAKSTTTPSEDAVVVNAYYAGVIDGATPKTEFRFDNGETPGHMAARIIAQAIDTLPPMASASDAIGLINSSLRRSIDFDRHPACNRPIASAVIYSDYRHEIWMVGDCQYLLPSEGIAYKVNKRIDTLLAEWRRDIIYSMLSRGIMTMEEIQKRDPGRAIIQPHIRHQVFYQNRTDGHPLAYATLDGSAIPECFIHICPIPWNCHQIILASDGYPKLYPSLKETEEHLMLLLQEDPLCIGSLLGTKGILPGNHNFDDRTYLSIEI